MKPPNEQKPSVHPNFLRSARVDQDSIEEVAGSYVVSASIEALLDSLSQHVSQTGQGAFTWTGPYGSGKSTLALVLAGLLSGYSESRRGVAETIQLKAANDLWSRMPPGRNGWEFVNVVGSNSSPSERLKTALREQGLLQGKRIANDKRLIEVIVELSQRDPDSGGLFIVFDELGKCLESIASGEGDAYFFQLLAEAASRSNGRLIFVGILHQAFQEYASKLAREVRDEWTKIQGRFIDLPVNLTAGEQIELIANALDSQQASESFKDKCCEIDELLSKNVPTQFCYKKADAFVRSWPLNPLVTVLLGPVSRRSYGQNQRSIFSFLASAERSGLQEFLLERSDTEREAYELHDFWDYLDINLHSAISVSLDGHHFATAKDAISRASELPQAELALKLIKTVSLLEFTSRSTGLAASKEVLLAAVGDEGALIDQALLELEAAKILVFQKFRNAYVLFDGSDFDIEKELTATLRKVGEASLKTVSDAVAVNSVVAKRHYLETGSLRWCKFEVLYESQVSRYLNSFAPSSSCFGVLIFCLEDGSEFKASSVKKDIDFAVCRAPASRNLTSYARELEALNLISSSNQELQRDKVARREVADRVDAVSFFIEREIWSILRCAKWEFAKHSKQLTWSRLSRIVSDLADKRYSKSPSIRNELLNRDKPSGNANAALKLLAYRLLSNPNSEALGIDKYPAEKGLYLSIVKGCGLHRDNDHGWALVSPIDDNQNSLAPLWRATKEFLLLRESQNVSLPEIYALWEAPPFGIKKGLMPFLALMFMLTEKQSLSFYRDGLFLTQITEVDVDYILRAPQVIQLRWMEMNAASKDLLTELANVASELSAHPVSQLSSLEVARSLIRAFDQAPKWVHRTNRLSTHARDVRALFKKSSDPNQFMFTDIPQLFARDVGSELDAEAIARGIQSGLNEILSAYSVMLQGLKEQLLSELRVPGRSREAIRELNSRAKNVQNISGDLRVNAFVGKLAEFDGSEKSVESTVGFLVNKPAAGWIDNDIDKAKIEMSLLAYQFLKLETVAHVAGRKDKRQAMALVQGGQNGQDVVTEFEVAEHDIPTVRQIERQIESSLKEFVDLNSDLILAALARVSAHHMVERSEVITDEK
jgi:energy-coupling factor transporter ATP-binding protein EcfA2